MKIALEQLGYANVYHFSSIEPEHTALWIKAMEGKYGPTSASAPFASTDFDEILGDYNASLNFKTKSGLITDRRNRQLQTFQPLVSRQNS
jgi:hypothetical protein